jgi:hypothetical protein
MSGDIINRDKADLQIGLVARSTAGVARGYRLIGRRGPFLATSQRSPFFGLFKKIFGC